MDTTRSMSLKYLAAVTMLLTARTSGQQTVQPDITMYSSASFGKVTCVAGTNTKGNALTFITPIMDQIPIPEFKYQDLDGKEIGNSIGCNFEQSSSYYHCSNQWTANGLKITQSGKHRFLPVTDERWNSFKTYYTIGGTPDYSQNYRVSETNFQISFSVRTNRDAQILLCTYDYYPYSKYSKCYWILIDAFDGMTTAIRKCTTKGIPDDYPRKDPECSMRRKSMETGEHLLDMDQWRHFTVSREDGNRIILRMLGDERVLLDYTDTESPLNVQLFYFRGYKTRAEWKIHDYSFLELTKPNIPLKIGKSFTLSSDQRLCISLYVSVCSTCNLHLILETDTREPTELTIKGNIENGLKWQRVELSTLGYKGELYVLYATALRVENSEEDSSPFWAIDDVRQCNIDEIRVASITVHSQKISEISCQSLQYSNWTFKENTVSSNRNAELQCEDPSMTGKFCNVKCNSILGLQYCDRNLICHPTLQNQQKICTCASGYTGKNCEQDCRDGMYGYDCQNTCGNCKWGNSYCEKRSGHCTHGCNEGYVIPYCNTTLPVLMMPPKIISISHTSVVLKLEDISMTNISIGTPKTYQIEYKDTSQNAMWKKYGEALEFVMSSTVEVSGLQNDQTYYFRAILYTNDSSSYEYDDVPIVNATTTCEVQRQMTIEPKEREALIIFHDTNETCTPDGYNLILIQNGNNIREINNLQTEVLLQQLTPYTSYDVIIKNKKYSDYENSKSFSTLEDAPEEVRELKTLSSTDSSLIITWKAPEQLNGNLRNYRVSYRFAEYINCPGGEKSEFQNKSVSPLETKLTVDLNDLRPYSKYEVSVFAVTIKEGPETRGLFETAQSSTVSDSELPDDLRSSLGPTWVNLYWTAPPCEKLAGPLTYRVTVECMGEPWCPDEQPRHLEADGTRAGTTIQALTPFTNYTAELRASRPQSTVLSEHGHTLTFTTTEGVPPAVRDLSVFSQTDSSISIRWKEPFPPHGYLDYFSIGYCQYATGRYPCQTAYTFNRIYHTPCDLYKDYYCYEISALNKNMFYNIFMKAKNQNVGQFGPQVNANGLTAERISEPPLNLTAKWDENKLMIDWLHPAKTNGPIVKFDIIMKQTETEISNQKKESYEFSLDLRQSGQMKNYSYMIDKSIPYSSTYQIRVRGVNKFKGEFAVETVHTPPEIPELDGVVSTDEELVTNSSVTITIPGVRQNTRSQHSYLYILVSKIKTNTIEKRSIENDPENFSTKLLELAPSSEESWIAIEMEPSESDSQVVVGDNTSKHSEELDMDLINKELEPSSTYDITVVLVNQYRSQRSYQDYKLGAIVTKSSDPPLNHALFALFLLLLVPIIGWFVYRHVTQKSRYSERMSSVLTMVTEDNGNQHEPDVIPLTESLAETKEMVQKKPIVAPRPIPISKSSESLGKKDTNTADTNFFHSRLVLLNNLEEYIKESLDNGDLDEQHSLFPRGQTKPWDYGMLKPNKFKNRYNNLSAYDKNRVKLEKINNDQFSDYINASFIHGYKQEKAYIATQGPKLATVNDFWRMIWQEKVQYIVMLANVVEGGKKKCEKYWPDIDVSREYGNIDVLFVRSEVYADFEYRMFDVKQNGETRKVTQLHFTSWPDHGVPLYPQSLVPFLKKMLTIPQNSPVVVHCSAGVGRTGTIILCDICLRMAAREGAVDVLRFLHEMREQRANMVDNIDQYKLVHMVLLECLLAPDTNIPCNNELTSTIQKLITEGGLQRQLNYLQQTSWQDRALDFSSPKEPNPVNDSKNRFKDIVPLESRVYISRSKPEDENSDYINAVPVDGFRFKQQFIVTQTPLPNTLSDFWRMIAEKNVRVIVSLNDIPPEDKTCIIFWPKESEEMNPCSHLSIKYHKTKTYDHYDIISVILHDTSSEDNEKSMVHVVQFKNWNHTKKIPNSVEHLVMLWEEAENISLGNYPMVVSCHDGATASGLFVGMSFVIEKIKLEQHCDVCLAVRVIRRNRKEFITDRSQFECLYKCAIAYLSIFETYSNFQPVTIKPD